MGLLKVAGVLAVIWGGVWLWGERRYSSGHEDGYAKRDSEYAAQVAATNVQLQRLERELEIERAAVDADRERAATNATTAIPNVPRCVQSECAVPSEAIANLNRIE